MTSRSPVQRYIPVSPPMDNPDLPVGAKVLQPGGRIMNGGKVDVLGFESEDEDKEGFEEEAQELKQSREPNLPSKEEIEAHRRTHYPFRNWCKFCIMGRGLGAPHARIQVECKIPIVHIDYFFVTAAGVKSREELEYTDDASGRGELEQHRTEGKILKCIFIKCGYS